MTHTSHAAATDILRTWNETDRYITFRTLKTQSQQSVSEWTHQVMHYRSHQPLY